MNVGRILSQPYNLHDRPAPDSVPHNKRNIIVGDKSVMHYKGKVERVECCQGMCMYSTSHKYIIFIPRSADINLLTCLE